MISIWHIAWLLLLPLGAYGTRYCRYATPESCSGTYHYLLAYPDPDTPNERFSFVTLPIPEEAGPGSLGGCQTADMNGDGWVDVLCLYVRLGGNSTDVVLLQNLASPRRKPALLWRGPLLTVPGRAWGVAGGDVDDDGRAELLVAVEGQQGLRLYWGLPGKSSGGVPGFSASLFRRVAREGLDRRGVIQLADVDGDGLVDVVMTPTLLALQAKPSPPQPSDGLMYLRNHGNRTHPAFARVRGSSQDPFHGMPVREAFFLFDLDRDGDLDLGFRETNFTIFGLGYSPDSTMLASKTRYFENVGNASSPVFQEQITVLAEQFPSHFSEYLWLPRPPGTDPHAGDNLLRVATDLVSDDAAMPRLFFFFNFIDLPRDYPSIPIELTTLQGEEGPLHGLEGGGGLSWRLGGPRLLFVDADHDGRMDVVGAAGVYLRNVGASPQQPAFDYRPVADAPFARFLSGLLNASWAVGVGDLDGDGRSDDVVSIRAEDGAVLWHRWDRAKQQQEEEARPLLPAFPGYEEALASPPPRLVVMDVDGQGPTGKRQATTDVLVLWHREGEADVSELMATALSNTGNTTNPEFGQQHYSQVLAANVTMGGADAYDLMERGRASVLAVYGSGWATFTYETDDSATASSSSSPPPGRFVQSTRTAYGSLLATFFEFTLPPMSCGPFLADLNGKGMPAIVFEAAEGGGGGVTVVEWGKCGFEPKACSMHGVCLTRRMVGSCLCMDGYAGPRCGSCAVGYAPATSHHTNSSSATGTAAAGGGGGGGGGGGRTAGPSGWSCVSCSSLGWGEHSTSDGSTCRCLDSFLPSPSGGGRCMCGPGFGYDPILRRCLPCPLDHYNEDFTLDAGGCHRCAAPLVTVGPQSRSRQDCVCPAGWFMGRDGTCRACDHEAMVCDLPGVNVTGLRLHAGSWREDVWSEVVLSCPYGPACRGGQAAGDDCCTGQRAGPLCSLCRRDYTLVVMECERCSVTVAVLGALAAMVFIGLVILLALYANRRLRVSGVGLATKLRICLTMYQILSAFKGVFETLSSSLLARLADNAVMQVLNGKVLSGAFALSCVPGYSFSVMLVLYATLPLALVAALAVWASLGRRGRWRWWQQCSFWVLSVVHLGVSDAAFRALQPCDARFDHGHAYLRSDYGLRCLGPSYRAMRRFALAAVLLYPIGLPLAMAGLLARHRRHVRVRPLPEHAPAFLRPLVEPYRPGAWYFEVVETLRKVLYVALLIAGPEGPANMVLLLLLTLGFESLLTHLRPYASAADQTIAEVAQWQLILTIIVTITLSLSSSLRPASRLQLEVLVVLLNCVVVLASLATVGKEVRDRWHEQRQHKGLHINEAEDEVKEERPRVVEGDMRPNGLGEEKGAVDDEADIAEQKVEEPRDEESGEKEGKDRIDSGTEGEEPASEAGPDCPR